MKKIFSLSIMFIFIIASTCFADSKIKQRQAYVGLNAGMLSYEENNFPDIEFPVLVAKAGYFIIDYIAIEGRFGFGIGDDTVTVKYSNGSYVKGTFELDVKGTFELDRVYGAYLSGYIPLKDVASIYAIAGYSKAKASAKAEVKSTYYNEHIYLEVSDTESDFSYGVGLDFYVDKFCVNVEYMNYMDKDDFEISVISAGIKYNF
ncbi:MAG: outer membrane beta-barrel protein [Desulforegulaceae bacterium]|nr:outer membrane beta-barrel protein [Desulforegulaceae bacterium]